MTEETRYKYILAAIITLGYGAVLIAYMWAPHGTMADDKTAAALMGGLSSGYLLVLGWVFSAKS